MIKLISTPNKNQIRPDTTKSKPKEPLIVTPVNGGLVTSLDSTIIKDTQATVLQNFRVRYNKTSRRPGTSSFGAAKPNSNKILALVAYDKSDGTARIIRFTKNSVHAGTSLNWFAVAGAALNGGDFDRFSTAVLEDRMFFANNGADVIKEINLSALTYASLGNADKYRYILGLGTRLLALNLGGAVPNWSAVAWSGDRNYAEWNPAVDATAGFTVLASSGSDLADPISGGVAFSNTAQIIRERSIWEAQLTSSYSNPFYFYQKIPGIGCDCPYSIAGIPNGCCFIDYRTKRVYRYTTDGKVDVLSDNIDETFFIPNIDKNNIIGAYSHTFDEYSILQVDTTSAIATITTFSFKTNEWWQDIFYNIYWIGNLDYLSGSLAIEELAGTIGGLVGTISGLSPNIKQDTFFYGSDAGDVAITDATVTTDFTAGHVNFNSVRESKTWELPQEAIAINFIELTYRPTKGAGAIDFYYSRDDGKTYTFHATYNWNGTTDIDKKKKLTIRKNLRGNSFKWKMICSSGAFDLIKFTLDVDTGGENTT